MRYCRFEYEGRAQYGLVEQVAGRAEVTHIIGDFPQMDDARKSRKIAPIALGEPRLLAPVQPSKIVCIGRNYREHAAELGNEVPQEPLLFLKPPSALLDPEDKILLPAISTGVDFEGELGVVIGKPCRNLRPN